jgi:outer membrane protein, heavy metal efflux system
MPTNADRGKASVAIALAALTLLGGCAALQPRGSVPQVQAQVAQRLDQRVLWHQTREERQQAQAMVRELMRDGMTAEEAVQIALINSPGLQATYERLGIAQADLFQSGLLDNPSLSLQYLFGADGDVVEASILQEFVGVFTLAARRKIGAAAATQATLEVSQAVTDRAARVREAYFSALADAQSLELMRQVIDSTEAAAELAARQYTAGTLARRDQLVQQAFHAQLTAEAARAEAQLAADRERIDRLLGLHGDLTQWRVPDRLPELPPRLPDLSDIEAAAISQRLDLAAANAELDGLARVAGLTRSTRWLSVLGIGVGYKREPGDEDFLGPEVELTLPLFDQGQGRLARRQGEFRAAERRLEQLAIEVRSEAREARLRLQAAFGLAQHYRQRLLPLQESLVDETLKFYNGMLVGVYDLLLVRQQQIQAARDYIAAVREFWVSWAELERAVGGRVALAESLSQSAPAARETPPTDHSTH